MKIIDFVKSQPIRQFTKGELLFSSSGPSDTFLAVREGFVKATTTEETGSQRILWIAGRYDIIPLERFFTKKPLQYDYEAYGDGSAFILDKTDFLGFIKANPSTGLEISYGLSEHFDDISERLSALGESDIKSKLLHTLYTLATKFSSLDVVNLHEIGLNLTHQDLADCIGASREVVSIELSKARKDKYISYSRSKFTVYTTRIKDSMDLMA